MTAVYIQNPTDKRIERKLKIKSEEDEKKEKNDKRWKIPSLQAPRRDEQASVRRPVTSQDHHPFTEQILRRRTSEEWKFKELFLS